MSHELKTEEHLLKLLQKLEQLASQIRSSEGFTERCQEITILKELVKEQVPHENTRSSAR